MFVEEKQGSAGTYYAYTIKTEEAGEDNGKEITYRVSLSPAARWKLDEFLDAVGAPTKGSAKAGDFLGRLVRFHVVEGQYNDRIRNEVDALLPAEGPDPHPELATAIVEGFKVMSDESAGSLDDIPF